MRNQPGILEIKNNIPTFAPHPQTPIEKQLFSIDLKNTR